MSKVRDNSSSPEAGATWVGGRGPLEQDRKARETKEGPVNYVGSWRHWDQCLALDKQAVIPCEAI